MGVELEFGGRITVEFEGFDGSGDTLTEAVCVTEDASGLRDDGIAVSRCLGEGFCVGITIKAAGIGDRVVLWEAVEADRGCGLVIAMDDTIEQEFTEGDAGIVMNHGFDEAAVHGHWTLSDIGIDDHVEGLEKSAEIAEGTLFVEDFSGEVVAGVADELYIGARQVVHGPVGQDEYPGIRWAILAKVEEAQAGELLFERASVFSDDFFRHGMAQVGEAEAVLGRSIVKCDASFASRSAYESLPAGAEKGPHCPCSNDEHPEDVEDGLAAEEFFFAVADDFAGGEVEDFFGDAGGVVGDAFGTSHGVDCVE